MRKKPGSDDKAQQRNDMNKRPGQQSQPNFDKQQQQGNNPRNPENPEINRQQQQQGGYQPQQGGKSDESCPPGSKPNQAGE